VTPAADPRRPFRWRDGERTVVFGRGAATAALEALGTGYTLLTTARGEDALPALVSGAGALHHVPPGRVDEVAAALRPEVEGELLVALGGGRVVDVAKALAAADPPRRVAAVPTTLSGAEMTWLHRHASGVAAGTQRVRPAIVVNDPALSASQPPPELTASALNALAHAVEAPATTHANPVATMAAAGAAKLLAGGLDDAAEPDRDALALGALLAAYATDSAWYGLHHVLSQTLVRVSGAAHGAVNAVLLPVTAAALRKRAPQALEALDDALGGDVTARVRALRGHSRAQRLRDLDVEHDLLPAAAAAAAQRPELDLTPPRADEAEILGLYESAW